MIGPGNGRTGADWKEREMKLKVLVQHEEKLAGRKYGRRRDGQDGKRNGKGELKRDGHNARTDKGSRDKVTKELK